MKENINQFITKLIDKEFLNDILVKLESEPDFLDYSDIDEFCNFSGKIKNDKLMKLLYASKKNKNVLKLLTKLLYYSDANTINDEAFNFIVKFPKKIRRTFLIALAHCKISFYQLDYINNLNICKEAFLQLLDIYCENLCFTALDLKNFLIKNHKKNSKYINDYLNFKKSISKEKIEIIKQFL